MELSQTTSHPDYTQAWEEPAPSLGFVRTALTSGGSILSIPYNWIHRSGQSRSCPTVATHATHQIAWELGTLPC